MAILLDTSVIIEAERQHLLPTDFLATLPQPAALAAITVAELLTGVERALPSVLRQQREAFAEGIISHTTVLPYDLATARVHAHLSAQLAAQGRQVGTHDMQIAATAIAYGYSVLTHNLRDFRRIPGVVVIPA